MQTDAEAGAKGGVRKSSRKRRPMNRAGSIVRNPYNTIVVTSVIFVVHLTLIPLGQMVIQTPTLAGANAARVDGGREEMFTPYYWKRILTSSIFQRILWTPLKSSLLISVCTAAFEIILDSLLAWLAIHSDLPYKRFSSLVLIIPYMIPSQHKSTAWLTIFKNERMGGAQGLLGFLEIQIPDWLAYGPFVIIVVLVIRYYAHTCLLVSSTLSSINSELEEMGKTLGAGKARILTKITFSLAMSATLSTVIVTFSKAMSAFSVPSALGLKTRYYTVSTTIYNSIQDGQNRMVSVISLVLIVIASFNVSLNQKAIGSRRSFSTIGGRGNRSSPIYLGEWRSVIVGIPITSIAVTIVSPVVILLYQSFTLGLGSYSLSNFTLHYWAGGSVSTTNQDEPGIFKNSQFIKHMVNTTGPAVLASLSATVFGQLIGHIDSRGHKLLSGKPAEQFVLIPCLISFIVFGAMYLVLFAAAKKIGMFGYRAILIPSLYSSFALLVFVAVARSIPSTSRAGASNIPQINTKLREATQVRNTGFLRRFFKIVFPLSEGGTVNGFMLMLIDIMKELGLIVVLMTLNRRTPPYMTYAYSAGNLTQLSDAVTIVMLALIFFVYWFANTFMDTDITKGF